MKKLTRLFKAVLCGAIVVLALAFAACELDWLQEDWLQDGSGPPYKWTFNNTTSFTIVVESEAFTPSKITLKPKTRKTATTILPAKSLEDIPFNWSSPDLEDEPEEKRADMIKMEQTNSDRTIKWTSRWMNISIQT